MDEKLRRIFVTTFNLSDRDTAGLSEQSSTHTVSNWDSLGHIRLILALEKAYGVSIPDADAIGLIDVEHIVSFLNRQESLAGRS